MGIRVTAETNAAYESHIHHIVMTETDRSEVDRVLWGNGKGSLTE